MNHPFQYRDSDVQSRPTFPLAVGSILNQTFEDFEIILSDNCSADPTPEVAKQFTDPRFKYIQTFTALYDCRCMEYARTHARGELIMMLSDDDALVGTALECFRQESERHEFLFSRVAEYRDQCFPDPTVTVLTVQPLPARAGRLRSKNSSSRYSCFARSSTCTPAPSRFRKEWQNSSWDPGRFFWTNGVEYSAWPIAAYSPKKLSILICHLPYWDGRVS